MEDNQQARALLRKKFLEAVQAGVGKSISLEMQEATEMVHGRFAGSDGEFTNLLVCDLKTRIGVEPKAIVRASDVIAIKLTNDNKTNK